MPEGDGVGVTPETPPAAETPTSISQLPVKTEAPATDDRFSQTQAKWKEYGLDLGKVSPKAVAAAMRQVREISRMDIPKLVEARARALADDRQRQATKDKAASVEEDSELSGYQLDDDDPRKILRSIQEELAGIKERETRASESARERQEIDGIKEVWARDYVQFQEMYPAARDPDVDMALRTVMSAYLAQTNDARAEDPGYVLSLAPQVLEVIARGGSKLQSLMDQAGKLQAQAATKKKDYDYGAMSDEQFEESLREIL